MKFCKIEYLCVAKKTKIIKFFVYFSTFRTDGVNLIKI